MDEQGLKEMTEYELRIARLRIATVLVEAQSDFILMETRLSRALDILSNKLGEYAAKLD